MLLNILKQRWKTLLALALALLVLLPFVPRHMIKDRDGVMFFHFCYYQENNEREYLELTEQQIDKLLDILEPLYCWRVWGEEVHFLADEVLEITLFVDNKPLHIVFGKRDYCYVNSGLFQQFDILNGDKATVEILDLLGIEETRINGRPR